MLMNIVCHRVGQQVAYGTVFRHAAADIGGGNFQLGDGQFGNTPARLLRQYISRTQTGMVMVLQFRRRAVDALLQREAGAIADHDVCQLKQLLPLRQNPGESY